MTTWVHIITDFWFYVCWDTPSEKVVLWHLPKVSSASKKLFEVWNQWIYKDPTFWLFFFFLLDAVPSKHLRKEFQMIFFFSTNKICLLSCELKFLIDWKHFTWTSAKITSCSFCSSWSKLVLNNIDTAVKIVSLTFTYKFGFISYPAPFTLLAQLIFSFSRTPHHDTL